jgi:hypothetical protein
MLLYVERRGHLNEAIFILPEIVVQRWKFSLYSHISALKMCSKHAGRPVTRKGARCMLPTSRVHGFGIWISGRKETGPLVRLRARGPNGSGARPT